MTAALDTSRPLRFAMVTTFYPPWSFGGDGEYVRRLSHALARRGHSVDVVHEADAYRLLGGDAHVAPLDEPPGVTLHTLRSPVPALSCLATHQLGRPVVHARRLRRILSRGFDVIHFHNVSLVGGAGILAYGTGVKLYTAHEHWLVCPTHTLWRHRREVCTGRQCVRCAVAYRRPPQLWRAGDYLARQARHVDAFIALSRFSADKHAEFGFAQPMTVLPSFVPDAPAAESPRLPVAAERPYFLFVGRLERIKGLQDVIPVFAEDHGVDLLIAGAGGYEPELRALAGDRRHIRFLGHQPQEVLRGLYHGALALITPSLGYEVFPLVVLEAFQHGLPIIARRLGVYREIVEESGGGLLFENRVELVAAIRLLASDRGRRAALGDAARRAFETRWSEARAIAAYLDLVRCIAGRRGLEAVSAAFAPPDRRS